MKMSIATRLSLGFLPALLALLTVGSFFFRQVDALTESRQWVTHTLEVLRELEHIKTGLTETENNATAYQFEGLDDYRVKAHEASSRMLGSVQQVRHLTRDNPAQQERIERVEVTLRTYLVDLLPAANAKPSAIHADPARRLSEPVRTALGQLEEAEQLLLTSRRDQQAQDLRRTTDGVVLITGAAIALVVLIGILTTRSITRPLLRLEGGAQRVGEGDYSHRVESHAHDEIGRVATVFNQMVERIEARENVVKQQTWIKTGLASFTPIFQSGQDLQHVCGATLSQLASLLNAPMLALYLRDDSEPQPRLRRCATVAAGQAPEFIKAGEGLAGQCLQDGRAVLVNPLPHEYITLDSALGSAPPRQLFVSPILVESQIRAVLEVALIEPLDEVRQEFLNRFCVDLGLVLNVLQARQTTEDALQTQTELALTLEQQRRDLQQSNQELALQSEQLRASERLAREQQEELRMANEEQQQANTELRALTRTLDVKAQQLAEVSAFKSEFLANMSHELRTPLNSLLILSKLLSEDTEPALSERQQQYARTIHEAGNDLLAQINEILDLARVESGKVAIEARDMSLSELTRQAELTFRHVAQNRHVDFVITVASGVADTLTSDPGRVWQIVKNLLSNAFKFTSQGGVRLDIAPLTLDDGREGIDLAVSDTGIGIPSDKQALIFEAFQQGDSGIARQYGGTGLGLSISQKLATLLGGSIRLRSQVGQGSQFTLWLPLAGPPAESQAVAGAPAASAQTPSSTGVPPAPTVQDAVATQAPPMPSPPPPQAEYVHRPLPPATSPAAEAAGPSLVVTTDEPTLLSTLGALAMRRQMNLVHASEPADLVSTCLRQQPTLVVMDVRTDAAPVWTALGHLKQESRTRHIGVHVLCHADQKPRAMRLGAVSCTLLPLTAEAEMIDVIAKRLDRLMQPKRNVLVVEDDMTQQKAILALIGNGDLYASGVATGKEALEVLTGPGPRMDCVVLDLGLPDMDGSALLALLDQKLGPQCPPVIIYTARALGHDQEIALMRQAHALIVKGAHSPERLIDEMTLLLSRPVSRLPAATRAMIDRSRQHDPVLSGRKVLVVDDDVRNIFAISAARETYGARVVHAENGLDGITAVQTQPDISLVLMDVMMPTLDGLETTRRIRRLPGMGTLPIIAVTAKAMPGDRESCLAAGASDYLSKPVDMDHLRAMIRVWLAQSD